MSNLQHKFTHILQPVQQDKPPANLEQHGARKRITTPAKYVAVLMLAIIYEMCSVITKTIEINHSHPQEIIPTNDRAVAVGTETLTATNQKASKSQLHIVTVADEPFADRYGVYFEKMKLYADKWGYIWTVLAFEDYEEDICPNVPPMYRGTCMVGDYMGRSTVDNDIIVFFDADYVPYRNHRSLEKWAEALRYPLEAYDGEPLSEHAPMDFVLYDRGFLDEIASGSFFARSSPKMVQFLREWANYYYIEPRGFSSADNGSMHIHLLRSLGVESKMSGRCGNKYSNLTADVNNLNPYHEFLKCCRESIPIGKHRHRNHPTEQFSIWIVGKIDPWAIDGVTESKPKEAKRAAIFHHGIKIHKKGILGQGWIDKYGLLNMTSTDLSTANIVNCGGHSASNCNDCLKGGHGEDWCNGDCYWNEGMCVQKKS